MNPHSSRSGQETDDSQRANEHSLVVFGIHVRVAHAAFVLFLINALLISSLFFPHLDEIGLNDDAAYINNGKSMTQGRVIKYSMNPLASSIHAAGFLLFEESPFWFVHSASLGRISTFCLLWLGVYLVALRLARFSHPIIPLLLLLPFPGLSRLLVNTTDALFTALSILALWQMIAFHQSRRSIHLWSCSALVGLSALARNDGLVVFAIIVSIVSILIVCEKHSWKLVFPVAIPCILIVSGYLTYQGSMTGQYSLGTKKRTYFAFEQGEGVANSRYYEGNEYVAGQIDAHRLYGTAAENDHSVFRAISNNPSAFLWRVRNMAKKLPVLFFSTLGNLFSIFLVVTSIRGIIEFVRRREYLLLLIILLWASHILVYFMTAFRHNYLLFPFCSLLLLSSVGISAWARGSKSYLEPIALSLCCGWIAYRASGISPIAFFVSSMLILSFWAIWFLVHWEKPRSALAVLVAVFCCAAFLDDSYHLPRSRELGSRPNEQAMLALRSSFEPGSRILAYNKREILAAGMRPAPVKRGLRGIDDADDMRRWLEEGHAQGIYVERTLARNEPMLWNVIKSEIGKTLEPIYASADGGIAVFAIR